MKKRNFFAVIALALCSMLILTACVKEPAESKPTDNSNETLLSKMDDDKCLQILKESGVRIPDGFQTEMVKRFLSELEVDPHAEMIPYSSATFYIVHSQLSVFVNMYYHKPEITENTVLSEMADDECKQFLTDVGVEIPDNYTMKKIRDIIAKYENDRNYTYDDGPGYSVEDQLHYQLHVLVFMYYE